MTQVYGIRATWRFKDGVPKRSLDPEYQRELVAVMRSLDPGRAIAFAIQNGAKCNTFQGSEGVLRAMHTVRLKMPELTAQEQAVSLAWLAENVRKGGRGRPPKRKARGVGSAAGP